MNNYLDFRNKIDDKKLYEASQIIKNGGIVVFPTETVYGIGTNGLNENAIKKLYQVKRRPFNKPISLLVSNIDMVKSLVEDISEIEYKLMEEFFPGPLTIILKKKNIVSNVLTANTDTIGIRMPEGGIARKLVEYANVPIATPSANITGEPAGVNLQEIIHSFGSNVDCYIDGGKCKIGKASTIIQVIDGKPIILREGSITKEHLYKKGIIM